MNLVHSSLWLRLAGLALMLSLVFSHTTLSAATNRMAPQPFADTMQDSTSGQLPRTPLTLNGVLPGSLTPITFTRESAGIQSPGAFLGTTFQSHSTVQQKAAHRDARLASVDNDDFDQATIINTAPFTTTQDTTDSTSAGDDPDFSMCGIAQGYHSVWYQYRSSYGGVMTVTTIGSTFDTVLGIWTGLRGALVPVDCNDDFGKNTTSQVVVSVTAEITYYIEVVGYWDHSYGELHFNLSRNPKPVAPLLHRIQDVVGHGAIHISWSELPVRLSDTYLVQAANDISFTQNVRTVAITTAQAITVTGTPFGVYYYRVRGHSFAGDSPWSDVVSATIRPVPNINIPMVVGYSSLPYPYNEALLYNMRKVKAPEAWAYAQAGEVIIIAILDTGVDSNHPDLQDNLVTGTTFVAGTTTPEDDQSHGTHVAGIAAGIANNGGIFGVAPRASIMPVKVCDSSGYCSNENIASGITWAVDNGAHVINMSLGGPSSTIVYNAVRYAYENGVVIICAAGNTGNAGNTPMYPGAYDKVIAVAATDSNDNWASFSTYGNWVDVSAPGVSVYSSYPWITQYGLFKYDSGTSMSSPHVAGVAALIRKLRPNWTVEQVYAHIRASVDDVGATGYDIKTGTGRINALKAVDSLSLAAMDALLLPTQLLSATPPVRSDPTEFVPGVILFKLNPGAALSAVLGEASINAAGLQAEVAVAQLGVLRLQVPAGEELVWLKLLRSMPEVEYAELDGIMHIQ
ncbi:MAG: S8 family serine peptidase [Anaerolineae bacterium]